MRRLNDLDGAPRAKLLKQLAIGFATAFLVFGVLSFLNARHRRTPMDIILNDSRIGSTFQLFRRDFPEDFEMLRQRADALAASGADRGQAAQAGFAFMQQWTAAHRPYLARTTDAAATALIADQLAILKHLATTDPAECAAFGLRGGMTSPHVDDATLVRLANSNLRDTFVAIKAGMTATAEGARMTQEDGTALVAQMTATGADPALVQRVASGGLPTASPAEQCRGAMLVGEAAGRIDPARRGRVARSLLVG